MDKQTVIDFFNERAAGWDSTIIRKPQVIRTILDNAQIAAGQTVLDVACGTGVLLPDYFARGVAAVTAVDISPEMVRIVREKTAGQAVRCICADASEYEFEELYDAIVIYDAFPHFVNPEETVAHLCRFLKPGGRLTVAHSLSRKELDGLHRLHAGRVSMRLPEAEELAAVFAKYVSVTACISTEEMYQVVGRKQ